MFQISPDTKIFVYCPSGIVTGGAELLHQLCDVINRNGRNAFIVYFGKDKPSVPSEYSKYNIKIAETIIDDPQNIVVIYEGIFDYAFKVKYAQLLLWWLSVDHFFYCQNEKLSLYDYFKWKPIYALKVFYKRIIWLLKMRNTFKNNFRLSDLNKLSALHAFQSEYAKDFLIKNHFGRMTSLKDYINLEHIKPININNRENYILYNPKKGIKFTQKLMRKSPNLQWIPIQNMSRNEVTELMRKSKVYVDFGYHPGKDRLPREAAINGCCIITGRLGSAFFWEDISIDRCYKFNQANKDVYDIINRLEYIINNYEVEIDNFYSYRNRILQEKEAFERDTSRIFNLSKGSDQTTQV